MRRTTQRWRSSVMWSVVMASALAGCGANGADRSPTSAPSSPTTALEAPTATIAGAPIIASRPAATALPVKTSGPAAAPAQAPSTPLVVHLIMPKAPKLNEEVEVALDIQAYRDAPGTTASIELPPAARVVRGDPRWQGDVTVNRPVRLALTIVFERTGEYTIRGRALRPAGAGMVWGDLDELYLTVKQDSGAFGFESGGQTEVTALPAPQ